MQTTCSNSSSICVNTPTFKCTVSSGRKVSPKQRHQHHLVPKWKNHNLNFLSCRYSHLPGAKICTPKNIKSPPVRVWCGILWIGPLKISKKVSLERDPTQRLSSKTENFFSPNGWERLTFHRWARCPLTVTKAIPYPVGSAAIQTMRTVIRKSRKLSPILRKTHHVAAWCGWLRKLTTRDEPFSPMFESFRTHRSCVAHAVQWERLSLPSSAHHPTWLRTSMCTRERWWVAMSGFSHEGALCAFSEDIADSGGWVL